MRWNLKEAVSKSLVRRTEITYKARLREISWLKATKSNNYHICSSRVNVADIWRERACTLSVEVSQRFHQPSSRNIDIIAADEDRLDTVRANIDEAEAEYAKYTDMITDKKNKLEMLSSKEIELVERTRIAEDVYEMFRQGGSDDVREKLIDVMYENQRLREENTTLKEMLEKAYEFMKQFVIDGVNLLKRFLESVGKVVGKIR